ncbi:uroporphyrinogen-III C-methyltransferase [Alicyclobacillus pomorum]|uniref:uroporphyrinogen-III C-methyltransferase n=1 Tax=Alicyclobacillus pomorum TaxID=204470 RepID=UPI000408C9C6|nr:uroporphyrinogen-III C-methyltransferase [Alicyclobacillus pomorum]
MVSGRVYLIGAGPGDPGLLTVKGKQCLERADAVVFDRLLSPRLLGYTKPGAELYFVGKAADHHTMAQESINQLLAELAKAGKTVVRLKGGDPFVFGRGGEEAAYLQAEGIPWEVVPGVTSAVAVPAYAGIPVTHRAVSPSFTVVTGHRCKGQEDSLDWQALANVEGTLLILMGVRQLPDIVGHLMAHGKAPDTPIALIRWGTRAAQETLVGTLADIVAKVEAARFQAPACIVIGPVVAARETLQWSELRPLFGKRILVAAETRESADALSCGLERLGAETVGFAVEDALQLDGDGVMTAITGSLSGPSSWVFHTALGVRDFFHHWRASVKDVRQLAGMQFAATSASAAEALRAQGIVPDFLAESPASKSLSLWVDAALLRGRVFAEEVPVCHPHKAIAVLRHGIQVQVLPWRHIGDTHPATVLLEEWLAEGYDEVHAETPWAESVMRAVYLGQNSAAQPLGWALGAP